MCRPRSQDYVEPPIATVSREEAGSLHMSRDNAAQQLAMNQQRDYGEIKTNPVAAFDLEPPPVGVISTQTAKQVPTNNKSRAGESQTKIDKNGKRGRPVIVVQHNYHDHLQEKESDYPLRQKSRGGVSIPFPRKLHEMLDKAMAEGHGDIVSWQPHGRCFVVHKPRDFQDIVLPKYFNLRKLSSFQRQLNLYGFQRLTFGRDRGGYYHECFLRHKEFLSFGIKRVQVKGTGVRARSNPDQEPNFWIMKWCDSNTISKRSGSEVEPDTTTSSSISIIDDSAGMQPTWNASISYQGHSDSKQERSNIWTIGCNGSSLSARVEDGNLVRSFGDREFHYLDFVQVSSEEQNMDCTTKNDKGLSSNSLFLRTFKEHQM